MITLVEALNFRCLRYVHGPLQPFHVLVGPNASGKTTFLDVIGFLCDLVSGGLEEALMNRNLNHDELFFRQQGKQLELAVEARIPDAFCALTSRPDWHTVRYELAISFNQTQHQLELTDERLLVKEPMAPERTARSLFPMKLNAPDSLLTNIGQRNNKVVINKVHDGNDNFYSETFNRAGGGTGSGWTPSFRLGPRKSALGVCAVETSGESMVSGKYQDPTGR